MNPEALLHKARTKRLLAYACAVGCAAAFFFVGASLFAWGMPRRWLYIGATAVAVLLLAHRRLMMKARMLEAGDDLEGIDFGDM